MPQEEWSSILESIANRFVRPLRVQGYQVWVFGDIQAKPSRRNEVDDRVKRPLPDGTPRELRVKQHRSGSTQVRSFRSTWDVTPDTWQLTIQTHHLGAQGKVAGMGSIGETGSEAKAVRSPGDVLTVIRHLGQMSTSSQRVRMCLETEKPLRTTAAELSTPRQNCRP